MSATDGSTAAVQQDQGTPSMVTTVRAVTAVVALLALLVCSTRVCLVSCMNSFDWALG